MLRALRAVEMKVHDGLSRARMWAAGHVSARLRDVPIVGRRLFGSRPPGIPAALLRRVRCIFDAEKYLAMNQDVAAAGLDAFDHFAAWGYAERRSPNPYFDSPFYLSENPDVARAGVHPLAHYLFSGGREGRSPAPCFDAAWYLSRNPDADASESPLEHFWQFGRRRGSSPTRSYPVDGYRASGAEVPDLGRCAALAVIVPVYRDVAVTRACLESVLAAKCSVEHSIIVVNDASPEPAMGPLLDEMRKRGVRVLTNPQNLGFVASVNRGMATEPDRDVVLLNSDTIVADGWLDRLAAHASKSPDVGTVTPFSNNATICSFPRMNDDNPLPDGWSGASLDALFARVNRGRSVEIPTAVGFCMFIRRVCLDAAGSFDEKTFGRGYGEENDFCLRASRRGFRHLLAADVFVAHVGEVSFADAARHAKARGQAQLDRRYPDYQALIQRYVRLDAALPCRQAVLLAMLTTAGRPLRVLVTHLEGGGSARHVSERIEALQRDEAALVIRPVFGSVVQITAPTSDLPIDLRVDLACDALALGRFVLELGAVSVEVHHTAGHCPAIADFIRAMSVPVEFVAHDYHAICPRIRLFRGGRYCGEPDARGCDACITESPRVEATSIAAWREQHAWLLRETSVRCPSGDVAERLRRYAPDGCFRVVSHADGVDEATRLRVEPPPCGPSEPLRVAVLGALSVEKGAELLRDAVRATLNRKLPLEFLLIGFSGIDFGSEARKALRVTGPYKEPELAQQLANAWPHVVWFPARCPETFSYTLSAAFAHHVPVVVPDLGAFPERIRGRPLSWVVPWDINGDSAAEFLVGVRQTLGELPKARDPGAPAIKGV